MDGAEIPNLAEPKPKKDNLPPGSFATFLIPKKESRIAIHQPTDSLALMESVTFAARLGTTAHLSPLLMKARRLGIAQAEDLERLAVSRGLRYYDSHGDSRKACPPTSIVQKSGIDEDFDNEELAITLLSIAAPYSQQRIRIGAAMLAAEGNRPEALAALAQRERCGMIVRYIAECGHEVEPGNPFWLKLLERLPAYNFALLPGTLPHPTRFVAMTGVTRAGVGNIRQWIRPGASQRT